jgi:hypothetical protein
MHVLINRDGRRDTRKTDGTEFVEEPFLSVYFAAAGVAGVDSLVGMGGVTASAYSSSAMAGMCRAGIRRGLRGWLERIPAIAHSMDIES